MCAQSRESNRALAARVFSRVTFRIGTFPISQAGS
jgi:hypothetical protein